MKVFILEERRDVHIRIYGIDGEQRTKEFFDSVLNIPPVIYPTTEAERGQYHTDGVYTFESKEVFDSFCAYIEIIQSTLDMIAEGIVMGDTKEEYSLEYSDYIV